MSKSKIFILLCISFVFGIFLGSKFSLFNLSVLWVLGLTVSVVGFSYISNSFFGVWLGLFLVFVIFGILKINSSQKPNELIKLVGVTESVEGYIVEDVDIREDRQLLVFQPKGFSQRVLVTTTKSQDFFYGDWIKVEGKFKEAQNFSDFDYEGYLKMKDIYAIVTYPKIFILKNNQLNRYKYAILKFKELFTARVEKFLEQPKSHLVLGILIGAKKGLPKDVAESFNIVGLSHIVAASGYNISILIVALRYLARILGRRLSFWFSLLIIATFVILAGASASIIRAGIMGALFLVSFQVGRPYKAGVAICGAATLMLAINPKILFWDIGFQLSFAATLGIVYGMPITEKWFVPIKRMDNILGIIFSSLCAILSTLPLSLLHFGRVSLYALPVNILVLPLIPFVMLFGFLIFIPFFGSGFAWVLNFILTFILKVATIFSTLPFASLDIKALGWQVVLMYLALLSLYLGMKSNKRSVNKIVV